MELFNSLKRRWVLAALVGGLVSVVAAAAVWMAMPAGKHQARATIRLKIGPGVSTVGVDSEKFKREKENLESMAQTRLFLTNLVRGLASSHPAMMENATDQQVEAKIRYLEENLKMKWVSDEYLRIVLNGDDPNQLQILLSAYANDVVKDAREEESRTRNDKVAALKKAIEHLNGEIKTMEDEFAKKQESIRNIPPEIFNLQNQMLVAEISQKNKDVTAYATTETQLQSQIAQIKSEIDTKTPTLDQATISRMIDSEPSVMAKQALLSKLRVEYSRLKDQLQPGHPKLVSYQSDIEKAQNVLNLIRDEMRPEILETYRTSKIKELKSDLAKKQNEVEAIKTLKNLATEDRDKLKNDLNNLVEANRKVTWSNADLLPKKDQRFAYVRQLSEIEAIDQNAASRIELKEDAQIMPNYNLKQKMLFSSIAGLVALTGMIGLIGLLEWRNRRVDGVDQVVTELGMRVIGTIPAFPSRASLRSGEASQNQNWRFILNESVNSTRTMLLHTARSQQMQILLVTSAMQGEGKTSLSSQLATSMATAGLRTLILDCDLRNPSMQKLFDIPVAPGCSEILLHEIDINDAIQPTSVPNLWIIPAGQCNHRVVAALAQGQPLEALFTRLRGQFDFIIVDSCPILPVADTLLVAQYVDGVIFSILQDVSQLPKVQSASDRLIQLNIPLLGAVVNGITPDIQAYGYNYVKQLPA